MCQWGINLPLSCSGGRWNRYKLWKI